MTTDVHELRHGYTLHDLEKMTRAAVALDLSLATDIQTRRDLAWSAIAEHLITAEEKPERHDLIRIGWRAIDQEIRNTYRHRGIPTGWHDRDIERPTHKKNFTLYWADQMVAPSPEGAIVERTALAQILPLLGAPYREAIDALAMLGNYQQAAAALGISQAAFNQRIARARSVLHAAWHEGETPRQQPRDRRVKSATTPRATHCAAGHEWTSENTITRRYFEGGRLRISRDCLTCRQARDAARRGAA